jgi:hypothetical protein
MDGLLTGVSSRGPYHWDRHPQARTYRHHDPREDQ